MRHIIFADDSGLELSAIPDKGVEIRLNGVPFTPCELCGYHVYALHEHPGIVISQRSLPATLPMRDRQWTSSGATVYDRVITTRLSDAPEDITAALSPFLLGKETDACHGCAVTPDELRAQAGRYIFRVYQGIAEPCPVQSNLVCPCVPLSEKDGMPLYQDAAGVALHLHSAKGARIFWQRVEHSPDCGFHVYALERAGLLLSKEPLEEQVLLRQPGGERHDVLRKVQPASGRAAIAAATAWMLGAHDIRTLRAEAAAHLFHLNGGVAECGMPEDNLLCPRALRE